MIAINNAYRLAPFADVMYFADSRWWKWNKEREDYRAFAGQKVTILPTGMEVDDPDVHVLRNGDEVGRENPGLSLDAQTLLTGRNGGYQAVNLAVLAGGNPILLLGYDMRHVDGRDHFDGGGHPLPTEAADLAFYAKRFRSMVEPLQRVGVSVINVTPGSALDAFPRASLEEALA